MRLETSRETRCPHAPPPPTPGSTEIDARERRNLRGTADDVESPQLPGALDAGRSRGHLPRARGRPLHGHRWRQSRARGRARLRRMADRRARRAARRSPQGRSGGTRPNPCRRGRRRTRRSHTRASPLTVGAGDGVLGDTNGSIRRTAQPTVRHSESLPLPPDGILQQRRPQLEQPLGTLLEHAQDCLSVGDVERDDPGSAVVAAVESSAVELRRREPRRSPRAGQSGERDPASAGSRLANATATVVRDIGDLIGSSGVRLCRGARLRGGWRRARGRPCRRPGCLRATCSAKRGDVARDLARERERVAPGLEEVATHGLPEPDHI